MSNCIKELYDYELVEKCRVRKNNSLKSNFNKNRTKKDVYRSECRSCCKKSYYENRDRLLNNVKIYNKENREKITIYEKNQRKIDFNFKLAHNIRVSNRQAFKSQNFEKLNKTFDLIGCSQSFLRKWILYQLHANMTEESYGSVWTIDYCYPLSKTNLSNETNMFISSHCNNLRPMFYNKNSSKGSKIDNQLCILQETKAKYFLKLNEERLNKDLHR